MHTILKPRWLTGFCVGLLTLAGLVGSAPARGQTEVESLWQTFTIADGLPSGNVLSMTITQDGALWFGTEAGVSRYDGLWRSLEGSKNVPTASVRAMAQTGDGALWFATDAGLARREADGVCCTLWTTDEGLPSDAVTTLLVAANPTTEPDGIWIGTSGGLVYFDGERMTEDSPVPAAAILATAQLPDGKILASVAGHGVWQRELAGQWQKLTSNAGVREGLWVGEDGRVWVGTSTGLIYSENGQWSGFPLSDSGSEPVVWAVMQDKTGGLWVGTNGAGIYYDPDATGDLAPIHFRAEPNGLVSDYVRVLALDRDGAVWISTIGGVNRYAGGIWQVIPADGLDQQRINTVLTDSAGRIWAGTERNGLAMWDGQQWQRFAAPADLPDNRVVALAEDHAGRIWVSTDTRIGYLHEADGWEFVEPPSAGLAGTPAYAFAVDPAGVVWLATRNGLSRWSEAGGYSTVAELAGKRINAVKLAQNGVLWVGTQSDGLLRLADGRWEVVADSENFSLNEVVANGIVEAADGSLWVGSYNYGLWQYRNGDWARMDANLSTPKLLALHAAGSNLWTGTRQGITRYDGQTWQSYGSAVLPGSGVLAVTSGPDGTLWIGTTAGLVHYRPERSTPWVRIDSVNLIHPENGVVNLSRDQVDVVNVQGGDLSTRADALVYLTQLEGIDSSPRIDLDGQITAYQGLELAPGAYQLRVRVRDSSFNYSAPSDVKIVVPQMVVLPGGRKVRATSFYTLLFLGLLTLIGMGGLGGMNLRARARARVLAAEVAVRQQEALARAFNPYVSGEPVRQGDMFFGRTELLQRILNALHRNNIMIHGERRMGKTSLLYQLADHLRETEDPEWAFIPVYIDLEGTPQDLFFYQLMETTWGVLQAYSTDDPPELRFETLAPADYTERDLQADLRLVLDRIKALVAPKQLRVILLLDEMDVVSNYTGVVQQQFRRVFMSSVAENLGAVVAGVDISKAWDRLESPWYNLFNEIALAPFTDEQARELLEEPVRGVYDWESEALDFVIQHADGRPYRLQQYALEAVNRMLANKRLNITLTDVEAAHEQLERARSN